MGSGCGRRGQPGRPPRGCRPRSRCCGRYYQAGLRSSITPGSPASACRFPSSRRRRRDGDNGRVHRPPEPAPSPTRPGSYQFKDAHGPRASTSARRRACAAGSSNYFARAGRSCRAHPPDGRGRGDRRVDRGAQRGRGAVPRVQPHQDAPAALQHPVQGRQVVPVPRGDARRGVAAGDGACGARSARASGTSGRTPTRTPSARRSTCCCARSRSAPARKTSSTGTSGSAARASTRTSRSARRPASATIDARGVRRARRRAARVPRRRARAGPRPARQADARGRRRARVRARGPAARPARLGAQGDRAPADGRRRRKRTST